MAVINAPLFLSRATSASFIQSTNGARVTVGGNSPRVDDGLGLLIEGQRTNEIRNPRAEGTTAGLLGTHWSLFIRTSTGVTANVLGLFSANGIQGAEISLSGTPVGNGTLEIYFETATGTAAITGQTWTESVFQQGIGLTGLGAHRLVLSENTSGGAFVTSKVTSIPSASAILSRVSGTMTLTGGATVGAVRAYWDAALTNGVPVSGILRLALPQMEQAPFASSPILPPVGTVAAATRFADTLSAPLSSLGIGSNGACTVVGTFVLPQTVVSTLNQFLFQIIADADNRFFVANTAATSTITITRRTAGAAAGIPSPITITAGQPVKVAASHNGTGRLTLSVNGSAAQEVTGAPTTGYISLEIGSYGGSNPLNGYAQLTSILPYQVSDAVLQQFSAV